MSHDLEKEQRYQAGSNIRPRKRLFAVHKSKNVKCEMAEELLTEAVRPSLLLYLKWSIVYSYVINITDNILLSPKCEM